MTPGRLVASSVKYYWRTHVAVVLGVATAVAVLAGALLLGDSVRGSLRDLVVQRLGATDYAVISAGFFREQLADDLRTHRRSGDELPGVSSDFSQPFDNVCPMLGVQGFVSVQGSGSRAGDAAVYGVDDRFWAFHGIDAIHGPQGRDALISPALAEELDAAPEATLLLRVQRPSDVPLESLHARKDDLGHTTRVIVRGVVAREEMGEFALRPQQGDVRAIFLPLQLLQRELGIEGRVNTLLVASKRHSEADSTGQLVRMLQDEATLRDFGINVRVLESRNAIALEANGGLLTDAVFQAAAQAAHELGLQPQPIFTYLANSLRSGEREVPYSLVTAMDLPALHQNPALSASGPPPILLSDWAARELRAGVGDSITMEYYAWAEPGQLVTRTAEFRVAGVVPLSVGDRDLAPVYPGITESMSLQNWDPPFPIDLRRIRPIDERYWTQYRTTPKAYIPFAVGQQLWQSRYGSMTSIRFTPQARQQLEDVHRNFETQLRERLDPLASGFAVRNVRQEGLEASRGTTDFGEYFVYFSFFLVVSALLLAALFFKLSIEQRAREVGLLRAVGFSAASVRRLFLLEGLLLSVVGSGVGVIGGVGYAYLMMTGLRTWWTGAVGTTALTLHISPVPLISGALGGILAAMACIWATLRGLSAISERSLLTDQISRDTLDVSSLRGKAGWASIVTALSASLGILLIAAGAVGFLAKAGAFFGAGAAFLAGALLFSFRRLALPARASVQGQGWLSVARLGMRNTAHRPARSVLSMAMIASAAFILISVGAFRKDDVSPTSDPHSGVGGYTLLINSLLPVAHDPAGPQGREALGLAGSEFDSVGIEPFRVRPGDDASCLNLYAPENPRIIAPRDSFLREGRFRFRSSLASNESERANPWLLLQRAEPDDAVPVIADANSMTYVLHRKLGDEIAIPVGDRTIRLRLVAALDDSIFQSELLMSDSNFRKLFPEQQGFRFFLVQAPPERIEASALAIENSLADFGADVRSTAQRLAEFHQVENTYLSVFQMLGALGLLLGTVGLGAVLLRNVLERRRELALLRALGYRKSHFFVMVVAENALLLGGGLLVGVGCALLAIAPVLREQGGGLPASAIALLLGSVLGAVLITSLAATAVALRSSLLQALRSE